MKTLFSLVLVLLVSGSVYAQKTERLVQQIERLANENIPEGASSVVSYSYSLEGCTLVKVTLLDDETTYDVSYLLSEEIMPSFYSKQDQIHDVTIGEVSFVLAFKVKKDANEFIKLLEKLKKKCGKS